MGVQRFRGKGGVKDGSGGLLGRGSKTGAKNGCRFAFGVQGGGLGGT